MPRQSKSKPAELTINSKVPQLTKPDGSPDPKSSPMNLEGIDLSSFGGDIGMDGVALPPLPQSPPIERSPGQHTRDPSKAGVVGVKSRAISEPEIKESRTQIRQVKDDEELRPSSSSVSKIYHLRKNPGSTPELSLVGSKENVQKQQIEGEFEDSCEGRARGSGGFGCKERGQVENGGTSREDWCPSSREGWCHLPP